SKFDHLFQEHSDGGSNVDAVRIPLENASHDQDGLLIIEVINLSCTRRFTEMFPNRSKWPHQPLIPGTIQSRHVPEGPSYPDAGPETGIQKSFHPDAQGAFPHASHFSMEYGA